MTKMNELNNCMNELRKTRTDAEISQSLVEYFEIVKNVANDYTDSTTVEQLLAEHEELSLFDYEEVEDILSHAKMIRNKNII